MPLIAKVEEGRQALRSDQDDITAITPVTAVRAAAGNDHFPSDTTAAVSAAACLHCAGDLVYEHDALLMDTQQEIVTMRTAREPLHANSPSARTDCVMTQEKCAMLRGRGHGVDADLLARASALEFYDSRHAGEEGVVFAEADIKTREELRPPLTHDDRACFHGLAAVGFHPKILRVAVPPVS